jgi:putative Holliday junction resolvase
MKFLGLDVGNRRVGIAFGDSELRLATPVDVITRATIAQDVSVIGQYVHEFDAARLIVGLPRNMDGTLGAQAEAVTRYAERVAGALNLPLAFWDERLTTVEATRRTQETDGSRQSARGMRRTKKSRVGLDAIAASVILQDYIDNRGDGGE